MSPKLIAAGLLLVSGIQPAAADVELAKVNGKTITQGDLAKALSAYNEGKRDAILRDRDSRLRLLENIIGQELMVQAAQKMKLSKSKRYRETMDLYRRQTLASLYVERMLGGKMTEAAAKRYYDTYKDRFSTTEVHAMHVLVADRNKALSILRMAKKPGTDFQDLAEKYSMDPSAKSNRGDLGFFMRDAMVKEFSDAAFEAKKGAIIGPVKTVFGYHVIKVVDRKEGKPLEYHEVELKVKAALRDELIAGLVDKLRKKGKVVVLKSARR